MPFLLRGLPPGHPDEAVESRTDFVENVFVIFYGVQLPTVCRTAFVGITWGHKASGGFFFYSAWALLAFEWLLALHLFRQVLALQGRHIFSWKHVALAHDRLERRLQYLAGKYAEHAPWWQFVVWTRILGIAAVTTFVRPQALVDRHALGLQVALTLVVYGCSLVAHVAMQPYAYRYQNRLETALSCTATAFILLGYLFFFVHDAAWYLAASFVDALLFVLLFGPAVFLVAWNLNLYLYARSHAAWYETEGAHTSAPLVLAARSSAAEGSAIPSPAGVRGQFGAVGTATVANLVRLLPTRTVAAFFRLETQEQTSGPVAVNASSTSAPGTPRSPGRVPRPG